MEQKIENTFSKAASQLTKLHKAFAEDSKLEKAMLESKGDITVTNTVRAHLEEAIKSLQISLLTEGVLDGDDEDGFMARSQLYFLAQDSIKLHGAIDDRDNLEPWVQSKIAQASKDIGAVGRYIEYSKTQEPQQGTELAVSENVDPDMLSDLFDNLKRGDKVKIKHDSALEKGTDYIEYIVKANNVLRNGVGKATLARADSPTSVKRFLYKRNGKVSMAIGDMAATLVDIQMSESINEAEKRWKQTSLTPAEAVAEYGKENVKVKKGALRNGDDMVEVFVEGYKVLPPMDTEKYQERSGLEGPFPTMSGKVVYYDPKEGSYYDPDTDMYISYDDFQALDNDYSGMKDERDEVNEAGGYYTQPVYDMIKKHGYEKVMHELLTSLDADTIQSFLQRADLDEAYSQGDENEEGMVSNCCGAPIMDVYQGHGRCSDCKEMASAESVNEGTKGCADCEWIKDETDGDIDTCDECAAEKRKTNEGAYKSHAQRKAVHASKAEKANEGMSFDDKQDSDLKTIAGDIFKNAKIAAKSKAKKS